MSDIIEHRGIVESTNDSCVVVRIEQTSACAACAAKGHCSSADRKEKLIEVNMPSHSYRKGDHVVIVGQTSLGMQAVLIAFVIPFIILLISVFVLMSLTGQDELLSVLLSFGLMAVYYIGLSFNKKSLKKKFSFTIKQIK